MTTVDLERNDIGDEDAACFAAALVATQAALHGMLSTVFDASCVCRTDGVLIECTPQLQQLLGGTDAIAGSDLCSFAASAVECRASREFSMQPQLPSIKLSTIQCSLLLGLVQWSRSLCHHLAQT